MKLEVNERGGIVLREVYAGIDMISDRKEQLSISMRDGGFELIYNIGSEVKHYRLVGGVLTETKTQRADNATVNPTAGLKTAKTPKADRPVIDKAAPPKPGSSAFGKPNNGYTTRFEDLKW